MREDLDSVFRRVEKLLAISNDHRANPNEAASAATMAQKIMRKYQIEESDVIIAKLKKGEDMGEECVVPTMRATKDPMLKTPRWASVVALQVSKLTQTRVILSHAKTDKGYEACVKFMGFLPDVKMAVYTMTYLQQAMGALRNDFMTSFTYEEQGRSALNSYTNGLTSGVCETLIRQIKAMDDDEQQQATASTSTSLVVAKNLAVTERFGEQKEKSSNVRHDDVSAKGYLDGLKIQVNRGIEGGASASPLMLT